MSILEFNKKQEERLYLIKRTHQGFLNDVARLT